MSRKWFGLLIHDSFLYQQPLMVSRFTLNLTTSSLGPPTKKQPFLLLSLKFCFVCAMNAPQKILSSYYAADSRLMFFLAFLP